MQASNKSMGLKRLGATLTDTQLQTEIATGSRYKKIQKRTLEKVINNIDKQRVKTAVEALQNLEQKRRKAQGKGKKDEAKIDNDAVGSPIYWNIKFHKNIEILNDKARVSSIGGSTAVQLRLPHQIQVDPKVLLFVREGDVRAYQQAVANSGNDLAMIKRVCTIKEFNKEVEDNNKNFFNKNLLKKMLN